MKRRAKTKGIDPKVLAAYSRWVAKHLDELVKRHAGKYIAVYRNKLVAVGNSYKEVWAAAERQVIEEPPLTMQVPGRQPKCTSRLATAASFQCICTN